MQTIEIFALSGVRRRPGCMPGIYFYLVDGDGVRLPGEYPAASREKKLCMVLAGIDQPLVDGKPCRMCRIPAKYWTAVASGQRSARINCARDED